MIRSFRHKGLRLLYSEGDATKVLAPLRDKIARVLARLDVAGAPAEMQVPGYRLHPLKGNYRGYWSVAISGNWRIVFRFENGDVVDVDLTDYH